MTTVNVGALLNLVGLSMGVVLYDGKVVVRPVSAAEALSLIG